MANCNNNSTILPLTIYQPIASSTISAIPNGGSAGTVGGAGTYSVGALVPLTATPASGYTFVNWTESGSPVNNSASYNFTASANRTLVANFALITHTISTSGAPLAGGGTSGGGTVNSGSSVTVVATPNANYAFVNWTEGGVQVSASASYTFTATANRALVANFALIIYTTTTSASPVAGGGTSAGGTVNSGSSVTVVAIPNANYRFVNWTEGGLQASTSASYSFTATANRTLVANFALITYTITTSASPVAGGGTSGGGTVNSASSMTVVATPNANYRFVNWTEGGVQVSTSVSYNFTASADRTLSANFTQSSYTVTASAGANGSISPNTVQTVNRGGNVGFTAAPSAGYRVSMWVVNGVPVQVGGASYTGLSTIVGPVTSDTTVQVSFAYAQGTHYWESTALTASANAAAGKRTGVVHASWPLYYYKGSDNNIWCVYYGGGTSWAQAPLTTAANVDDWLTVLPYYNLLCYRGTDGNLYAVYLNGSTWATAQLSSLTANVAGDLAVDPVRNVIYYRGTDGGLWVAYISGGVWTQLSLTAVYGFPAIVGGDLSVDATSHFVYFRGTDSHLYVAYYNGVTWLQVRLTTNPNVGGALTADSGNLLYYRSNTDNTPWASYFNLAAGAWAQVQLDAGTTISTGTSVSALYALHTWLYLDANGQCGVEYVSGTWTHAILGDGGSNLVGGLSVQHGTNWGFAQRSDGHVVVFYYR